MNFSDALKKLMAKEGMNQKQFAKHTGMTEAAISRYLNGNRYPSMNTLIRLKDSTGCAWEDLLG